MLLRHEQGPTQECNINKSRRRPEQAREQLPGDGAHREEEQEEAKVEDEEGSHAAADEGGKAHGSFREVGDAQASLSGRLVTDQQRIRHIHEAVQVVLLCSRIQNASVVTWRFRACVLIVQATGRLPAV